MPTTFNIICLFQEHQYSNAEQDDLWKSLNEEWVSCLFFCLFCLCLSEPFRKLVWTS